MIHPIILCGGSGTRLWPLSRQAFPKQFASLFGAESLFQASVRRFSGTSFAAPIVLAHADFRFLVLEQLSGAGVHQATVLLESSARNTAPAILAAALQLDAQGAGDDLMLVAPSDHVVHDVPAFLQAVDAAEPAARDGAIVTFGVRPDRPETGYGYLHLAEGSGASDRPVPIARFVEKPDAATAAAMLADGGYLWNAGIFLFSARTILAAFETHAPEMLTPVRTAVAEARHDLGFVRLNEAAWDTAPDASIDYAIMEKTDRIVAMPLDCGWSDLGSWDAIHTEMQPDADGMAVSGSVTQVGCANSLLRSEKGGPRLVGVNLEGIAAIAMGDAVLVADLSNLQDVKAAVGLLRDQDRPEADAFPRVYRPWGWYESIVSGHRFQVKQIMVPPGHKLSLQSHAHRAEHWVVVAGTARVTVNTDVRLVTENESVYIPLGAVHRLENPGRVDLYLIEVQTGSYLGEDDIVRYEDIYDRDAATPLPTAAIAPRSA